MGREMGGDGQLPHVKGIGGEAGRRNFTKHQHTATLLKSKSKSQ